MWANCSDLERRECILKRQVLLVITLLILLFLALLIGCGGGGSTSSGTVPIVVTATPITEATATATPYKTGNISGQVFTNTGAGFSNAFVEFQSFVVDQKTGLLETSALHYTKTTTAGISGYYAFANIPQGAGRISFWASQSDYQSVPNPLGAVNITVTDNTTGVNIQQGQATPNSTPEPTKTLTPVITPTPKNTPTVTPITTYSISGKIYSSLISHNNVISGVTLRIYKLDSNALRIGSTVYTDISDTNGSWGPFQAEANTYYEIELSKTGFTPVYHVYLPQLNSNRTDANLEYYEKDDLTYVSGGFVSIARDTTSKKIYSSDIIKLNNSDNLNSSTVSNGSLSHLKIYKKGTGDQIGTKDYMVNATSSPGLLYLVTYNQAIRAIRVFQCSTNHRTGVVFY